MSSMIQKATLILVLTCIVGTKAAPLRVDEWVATHGINNRNKLGGGGKAGLRPVEATNIGGASVGGAKKCAFQPVIHGGAKVAVWAKQLKLKSAWSPTDDGAMMWKDGGGARIDKEGTGTVCMGVRPDKAGLYSFTTVSAAPHPTDHNDAWFRFSSAVTMYRPERKDVMVGEAGVWYKGFQNEGGRRKANYILTKDHDGHQFVLGPLKAGKKYSVCVSGRSSRFRIYKFVFVKCPGPDIPACDRHSAFMKRAMNWLPPSPCV